MAQFSKTSQPGLRVTQADYDTAKAGGIATPTSDLEAARIAYERQQANQTPSPTAPAPGKQARSSLLTQTTSNVGITGGSDNIRNERADNRAQANELYQSLVETQDLGLTDMKNRLGSLDRMLKDINTFSEDDLAQIKSAGMAEGAKFDPMIAEAQQSRTQGLAKATVGAGEKGGFLNTQYAGQAALTPTQGGDFVGAGGELSRVKGVLEQNIQNLQIAKQQAIAAAEAATRKAIRTGKQQDLSLAQEIYGKANEIFQTEQDQVTKRLDVLQKIEENDRQRVQFGQDQELNALKSLEIIGATGDGQLSEEDQMLIDRRFGEGFTERYKQTALRAQTAKEDADKASVARDIIDIMSQLPAGTKQVINGVEYEGIATADPNTQIFSETDAAGNVTFITIDKGTGEIIGQASGGRIGKGFKSSGGGSGSSSVQVADESQMINAQGQVIGFRQRLKDGTVRLLDPSGVPLNYTPNLDGVSFVNIGTQKFSANEDDEPLY